MSRKYQNLVVWQSSMDLVTNIYGVTANFPGTEKFGLVTQLRRVAVSVPSNIAEGSGRGSDKDFIRLLKIAKGSLLEIETQILIAERLEFISTAVELTELVHRVFTMLTKLIDKLNGSTAPQSGASVRRPTSDVRPTT